MFDYKITISIVSAYFIFVLAAVLYSRFKTKGSIFPGAEEFFLAGRNVSTFVLMLSFLGTLNSAFLVVGLPGAIYTHGIASISFVLFGMLCAMLIFYYFAFPLRRFALENKILSPVEIISYAYKSPMLGAFSAAMIIGLLCPYIALQLVGLGKVLEGLSGGEIGYISGVGSIMGIILLYVLFGGIRAIAYTDVVQTIAIYIGIIAAACFFVSLNWSGLDNLFTQVSNKSPEHLTLPGPSGLYTLPYFVASAITIGFVFFQPQFLTRIMMAKDDAQIKATLTLISTIFFIGYLPPLIFGLGAVILYPDLESSNLVLGTILKDISAAGFIGNLTVGLLLIGLIGASMSSADSQLIAIGQIFTRDLVRRFHTVSHNFQVVLARAVMFIVLIVAFIIGINPPEIMLDLALYSIKGTAIFVPTYVLFEWKYRSKYAAFASLISGFIVLAYLAIADIQPLGFNDGFWALLTASAIYLATAFIIRTKSARMARAVSD